MQKHTLQVSLAFALIAPLQYAHAEPDTLEEQVVITGTRTTKALEDSPVPIEVISGPEIDMVSSGTMADTLNYIPGLSVRSNEKDGFNVLMQGFDGDRVLVLVDGQPLISPTGNAVDLGQISALNIKQVEVIKGPSSILYGSAAMGGVINIITMDGLKNFLKFGIESGSYSGNAIEGDEYRRRGNISGGLFNPEWAGQFSYQNSDDPGFEYDPDTTAHDAGELKKEFFQSKAEAKLANHQFNIGTRYFTEDKFRVTGPFPAEGDDFYRSNVEQRQLNIGWYADAGWQILSRYNTHTEQSGLRTGLRDTDISGVDIDTQYAWNINKTDWVIGARYYRETLDQQPLLGEPEVDDKSRDGVEAFAQADWYVSQDWEIVAGVRVQDDAGYGGHSAARLNSMWHRAFENNGEVKWRTSLGQGYRVPTLKERFFAFDHSNIGYKVIGSPNLQPETTLSLNTGVEYTFNISSNVQLQSEISTHYSQAENFIVTEYDAAQSEPGLSIFVYSNEAEVTLSGGDLSLGILTTRQKYNLSYTYLDARNAITKARLSERPYHQIKANYWWFSANKKIDVLSYLVYENDEATGDLIRVADDFLSLNLVVNVDLSKNLSWRLGMENILDDHRDVTIDPETSFDPRPIDSRYIFVGFSYQLD